MKHNAVSNLLKILKEYHPDLPTDSRTLLQTSRDHQILIHGNEEYCYFGIKPYLQKLSLNDICPDKKILVRINIDGLPLCKSTRSQFWPILGLVVSKVKLSPFLIACHYGNSKPVSLDTFLSDFICEVKNLKEKGIMHNFILYHFDILHFNCDAPARSFIKCIKNHNSYYGCEKCTQKGVTVNGHVKFLEIDSPLRTDYDFSSLTQQEHHISKTPLMDIDFFNSGLITKFPLDCMHLVDLGVMRKLILYWIRNGEKKIKDSVRICQKNVEQISQKLATFTNLMPAEFSRKPRSLKYIDLWKATEFRQFILYLGPVVLKDILPRRLYIHFLCLHVAINILSNPIYCKQEIYIDFAEKMLKSFVEDMKILYSESSLVYNVHNLVHIPNDVRLYGDITNFSCYVFENYLGQIKGMLRSQTKQLSQLCRRLSEQVPLNNEKNTDVKLLHHVGSFNSGLYTGEEYSSAVMANVRVSSVAKGDNCILLKDKRIMVIKHIIKNKEVFLLCHEVLCNGSFFSNPCDSSVVSIFNIAHKVPSLVAVALKDIFTKCILCWVYKVVIATIPGC